MKVILIENVYKQGVAGDVVDVAPGFARNYLIPHGMAVKATPGELRRLEHLRGSAEVRRAERDKEYTLVAEKIENLELYFGVKAGETGKLYGSVTSQNIAEALLEEIGIEVDHRRIGDRPLRELGEYSVPVRLEAGLSPVVKVVVFPEDQDPREMPEVEEVEEPEEMEAAELEEAPVVEAEAEAEPAAAEAEVDSEAEAVAEASTEEPASGEA